MTVLLQARELARELEELLSGRIIAGLAQAGAVWADLHHPLRRRAVQELPELLEMSPEMVGLSLDMLAAALDEDLLRQRLRRELVEPQLVDGWTPTARLPGGSARIGDYWRARPRGVVLTVAAGNVFVGSAMAMAESLLTKNVTLLKAPSADPLFAELFAQSLGELSRFVFVLRGVEDELVRGCDAVVVTGGAQAIEHFRNTVSPGTPLIDYGPRLSLAAVARGSEVATVAQGLARDMSLWDQQACSAPQVLYLEGEALADELLPLLAQELEALSAELPRARPGLDQAVEIVRERELALFAQAQGREKVFRGRDWLLVYQPEDPILRPSPLFRTLLVKQVNSLDQVAPLLEPHRSLLQTVGLAAPLERARVLAEEWTRIGASRVTPIGAMSGGSPGEPHDGRLALQALVRWVTLRTDSPPEISDDWETLPPARAAEIALEKARGLLTMVGRKSPFYAAHWGECRDFSRLPLLERRHLEESALELLTAPLERGVVLRSGGTTGEPKYAFFSPEDYQADIDAAVKMLYACGVRPGDRCANLFLAGDLYGSFLSIHRLLEACGVLNFPFSASAPMESLLVHLEKFKINVVLGVSSQLSKFFAELPPTMRVEKVVYGGEAMADSERRRLRERFGVKRVASLVGANDGGPIGYQCPHCEGAVHHLASDHILLEVVDPETLAPVPVGRPGELVITALRRRLMPLVRYRLGDRGRLLDRACACGRTTPLFELLGRADDVLCIASTNTAWHDVAEALGDLSGAVQLVGRGHSILVRAEVSSPSEELAAQARQRLLNDLPVLAQRLSEGVLSELSVELVPPGRLERHRRTGKLKRVVDLRV